MLKATSLFLRATFLVGLTSILTNCFFCQRCNADDIAWKSQCLQTLFYSEGGSVGDLDNDGKIDLIAGPNVYWGPTYESSSKIYDGQLFSINGYSDNFFSWTWDIDRDGNRDVIVAGFPGAQGWWFKNPGTDKVRKQKWERFVITDVVDNESPAFTDITGDGVPELICSQHGRFGYLEIPKAPQEAWAFHPITAPGGFQRFTHGLGIGDVNDDGRKDLLAHVGWWEAPPASDPKPSDETWEFHPFEFTPAGGAQMHAVDFDGDGKTEVVTSLQAHGHGLSLFRKLNKEGTQFEKFDIMTDKAETSSVGLAISQLHAVEIGDVNRDGVPDIITGKRFWAHQGHDVGEHEPVLLIWLEGKKTDAGMRFVAHVIDNDSGVGTQITVADVTGDGNLDIFSASKRGVHLLTQVNEWPAPPKQRIGTQLVAAQDSEGGFLPADSQGKPLNLDFETGDLTDWTATGSAFFLQPVDAETIRDQKSGRSGKHWIGTAEIVADIGQGNMESAPFKVLKPKATIRIAGGSNPTSRVAIVDAESKEVLFQTSGKNNETMELLEVDTRPWLNRLIRIQIIDAESGGWGHIHFDDFRFRD